MARKKEQKQKQSKSIIDEGAKAKKAAPKIKKDRLVMAQAIVDGKVVEIEMLEKDVMYNQQVPNPMTTASIVYPPVILNRRLQEVESSKGYFEMNSKEKEAVALDVIGRYTDNSKAKKYTGWAAKLRRD